MTDYEYILQQAKKFHYSKWDDEELRKCMDMLTNLSRQELSLLYQSRWVKDDKVFRESIFNTLFKDKVGKREQRIKEMDVDTLIEAKSDQQWVKWQQRKGQYGESYKKYPSFKPDWKK